MGCPLAADEVVEVRGAGGVRLAGGERAWRAQQFACFAALVAAPAVEREPPGHPYEPGAEPFAVAQLAEVSIRPDERFLRDVLGVLLMPQHAVGDAKCQR